MPPRLAPRLWRGCGVGRGLGVGVGRSVGVGVGVGLGVDVVGLAVGDQTTGTGNVYIGGSMVGLAGESNKTYIRNINSTGLNGAAVTVDVNTGLLGHATSSRRYKEEIRKMNQASEALYQLKPVTFRYKKEIDRTQALSFGLIAEEVAEVNPDLIVRNSAGKPEAVNAMLLNEFLKEHRKVQEQETAITQLRSTVATQQSTIAQQRNDFEARITELKRELETVVARFKAQDAKIQKVSDRLEFWMSASQTVVSSEEQEATIARLQKQVKGLTVGLEKVSAQLELSKAGSQTALNAQ